MIEAPLVWKNITSDEEALSAYSEIGGQLWGAKYPLDYLKQGRVMAAYTDGEMVGGYALIFEGPFRTLRFLPEAAVAASPTLSTTAVREIVEIAGFWFKPSQRIPAGSLELWKHFLEDALSCGRQYAIYGYNLERKSLFQLYRKLDPETLFNGPISAGNAPSGNHHGTVAIEIVPISRARQLLPLVESRRWHFHRVHNGPGLEAVPATREETAVGG